MKLDHLTIEELLYLFLNIKGFKNNRVLKTDDIIVDYFQADSIIKVSATTPYKTKPYTDEARERNLKALQKYYSNLKFEKSGTKGIQVVLKNPEQLTLGDLLKNLYSEITMKQLNLSTRDFSKAFAIGAFGTRGSIDLARNFYTADLHSSRVSSKQSLDYFIKLLFLTDLNSQLNLNFRELQPDHVNGKLRDTQFRINLYYFNKHFRNELSEVNPFRAEQLSLNSKEIERNTEKKESDSFLDRIQFYKKNIVGEPINDVLDVKSMRKKLNFANSNESNSTTKKRDNKAKEFAILNQPDLCAGCQQKYNNQDRTFYYNDSKIWYFELHLVISFANKEIQTENPSNYVKLCPACHRALTPNRANESYQKELISAIFENNPESLAFTQQVQKSIKNEQSPIDFIFNHLR